MSNIVFCAVWNANKLIAYASAHQRKEYILSVVEKLDQKLKNDVMKRIVSDTAHDFKYYVQQSAVGRNRCFIVFEGTFPLRIISSCANDMEVLANPTTPMLSEIMKKHNNLKNDSILRIHEKIDAVKDNMIDAIDDMLERNEKLEDVLTKAEDFNMVAIDFKKGTQQLKNQSRCKYISIILAVIGIILLILTVAAIIITTAIIAGTNRLSN